ncbi:hypothetical protein LguiB_004032 [Lonicera macranthoides]
MPLFTIFNKEALERSMAVNRWGGTVAVTSGSGRKTTGGHLVKAMASGGR